MRILSSTTSVGGTRRSARSVRPRSSDARRWRSDGGGALGGIATVTPDDDGHPVTTLSASQARSRVRGVSSSLAPASERVHGPDDALERGVPGQVERQVERVLLGPVALVVLLLGLLVFAIVVAVRSRGPT